MFSFHIFVPSAANTEDARTAATSLSQALLGENPEASYSAMMRCRLAGATAASCDDTYFLASDDGACFSRLWYGWGRHPDAVGNFGNFKTAPEYRGRGAGSRLLEMLFADLKSRKATDLPLALFCTCSQSMIDRHYGKYGFRPACAWSNGGPAYCPLGNSPETFEEFRDDYYRDSTDVRFVDGDIGWRHEIDCLLKFALLSKGLSYELESVPTYEEAWLRVHANPGCGKLECLLNSRGHAVGWAFTPAGHDREIRLYR